MTQLVGWEISMLDWIQRHFQSPGLDWFVPKISALGNGGALWIGLALVLLALPRYRKAGAAMALALILCGLVGNLTLKPLIARARPFAYVPDYPLLIGAPSDFSFPSGHTLSSVAAATTLFLYYRKAGSAALVLAGVIGLSRLYLYVHFPSDVIAGCLLGISFGILARKIVEKVWPRLAAARRTRMPDR